MRLRNKKTGEVFDALIREKGGGGSYSLIVCDIKAYEQSKSTLDATHFVLDEYDSLAELNEDWEDYEPKEPLIKDEKVRELVRKWAKINCLKIVKSYGFEAWVGLCGEDEKTRGVWSIELRSEYLSELEPNREYTIAELCGGE